MVSATRKLPGFMMFKGMTEFKVGSGFIWKKVRKVLPWSVEGAEVREGRRNSQVKWKRICSLKFSGCVRKMLT